MHRRGERWLVTDGEVPGKSLFMVETLESTAGNAVQCKIIQTWRTERAPSWRKVGYVDTWYVAQNFYWHPLAGQEASI